MNEWVSSRRGDLVSLVRIMRIDRTLCISSRALTGVPGVVLCFPLAFLLTLSVTAQLV